MPRVYDNEDTPVPGKSIDSPRGAQPNNEPRVWRLSGRNRESMTIRPLADFPERVPILARWFHAEWHDFDGRALPAIESQLCENLNRDRIPITFLALSGSELVGTVSLDLVDLPSFDHLSPWLASLYVLPEARRRGIGTALVQHAQRFALANAISPLYLWTSESTRLYEKCGWTILQRSTYNSHPVTLMGDCPVANRNCDTKDQERVVFKQNRSIRELGIRHSQASGG